MVGCHGTHVYSNTSDMEGGRLGVESQTPQTTYQICGQPGYMRVHIQNKQTPKAEEW